jgi:hypothetical protein
MERSTAARTDRYLTPGVYFEEARRTRKRQFRTGQPAFIGAPEGKPDADARRLLQLHWLSDWDQFRAKVGRLPAGTFLAQAVRGFFENGGERCVVVTSVFTGSPPNGDEGTRWEAFLDRSLRYLESVEDIDLVCAPDLPETELRLPLQQRLLEHCDAMRTCFAILDAPRSATSDTAQGHWRELVSANGALYFPWIQTLDASGTLQWVPPCGHLAGIYAKTDARVGVHKAPANEVVEGAVDVAVHLDDEGQSVLNGVGVNCLRVRPGRGIRVWGARTLSGQAEWRYVNVRRLFITVQRWLESETRDLVFEANQPGLWDRIRDRVNNYCYTLYQSGALQGSTPQEAYYVKCDAETNPLPQREAGEVTTEIGLAPNKPAEFIVVRITQSAENGSVTRTSLIREGS